jgi:hypothetical protein
MGIYNKIVVAFNILAPKDIPYRSEALVDFLQATILDELHQLFSDVDMGY